MTLLVLHDDAGANDVGGHEVWRELDAAVLEVQDAGQGAEKRGLAEAGHAFQQHVSAGEKADHDTVDHVLLADDDLTNFTTDGIQLAYSVSESGIN